MRNHLVGLPLQRSTFGDLSDILGVLDVPLPETGGVILTDAGELLVDDRFMSLVGVAARRLDVDETAKLAESVRAKTAQLENSTERSMAERDPITQILLVGEALRAFLALPILGKAITGALNEELVENGFTGPPPAPVPSPGVRLTVDLLALGEFCSSAGVPPHAVAERWPRVPESVQRLVASFARDHIGFGPLPWEARGWENPAHVAAQLATISGRVRLPAPRPNTAPSTLASVRAQALHDCLAAWLDATERGLILVRRAFYIGIRPHLADLAHVLDFAPVDVLFLTFDELATGLPAPAALAGRREAYATARSYLDAHRIVPADLDCLAMST